jgi:kumamolisin
VSGRRVQIPGSAPQHPAEGHVATPADPNQKVIASVIVRRRPAAGDLEERLFSGRFQPLSQNEAAEAIGADPGDLEAVRSFAERYGMKIVDENAATRTIRVSGTVQQMDEAFGVRLGWFPGPDGRNHLSYEGTLSVPEQVAGVIMAVLGLDQRPIARHR